MSDAPDFAAPVTLTTRESLVRPGQQNERHSAGGMTVQYGMDAGMMVTFFEEPEHMEFLSKQCGHPIYRMRIMTRIVMPGNRTTVWVHATKGIKYEMVIDPQSGEYHTDWEIMEACENGDPPEPVKYPNAWRAFERKGISSDSWHPIEQWGTVTRSYAESLKSQHIHTVEALAGLTDQAAQSIMGGIKYRDLARAYLDERASLEIVSKEQERAARAEERNRHLEEQVSAMQAHIMNLNARLNSSGAMTPEPAGRMVGSQPTNTAELAAAGQVQQRSVEESKRKHKIPPREAAA